jgi:deazaflavin-dependent oxidoreductase (nitroreductase family)
VLEVSDMSHAAAISDILRPAAAHATAGRRPRQPRLLVASVVLAMPDWVRWGLSGGHAVLTPALRISAILAANALLTRLSPGLKLRLLRPLARYVINPPVRALVSVGALPLGFALLETTGRSSGRPRRVPIGEGLVGDTFWIVAEHGDQANYVRNITRDPHVRVKVRRGLRPVWRDGIAHVLEDDDPHARQRLLSRRHPMRALNAAVVRVMGTDLLTVRIDLDSAR